MNETDSQFFVQGGASAVGMYAVQLAKLIGYKVAATCSPHSFDLVKGLGADLVVDYHNPAEAVKQIKEASNGKVVGSLECIGGKENTQLAVDTFGEAGGKLTVLLGVPEGLERAEKIKSNSILLYVVGGYVRPPSFKGIIADIRLSSSCQRPQSPPTRRPRNGSTTLSPSSPSLFPNTESSQTLPALGPVSSLSYQVSRSWRSVSHHLISGTR
jgi:hypothetical protein